MGARLLDENDAEIQTKVLDCLLIWKDDFLLPYSQQLKNLASFHNLREELTTWSLSRESNLIEEEHRPDLVPMVIRLLMPKVRKLKKHASQKVCSVLTCDIVYLNHSWTCGSQKYVLLCFYIHVYICIMYHM